MKASYLTDKAIGTAFMKIIKYYVAHFRKQHKDALWWAMAGKVCTCSPRSPLGCRLLRDAAATAIVHHRSWLMTQMRCARCATAP